MPHGQQIVYRRLVLVGDLGGQCEDEVEVADRQQVGRARGDPISCRRPLALGTMAVAPRVIGDPAVAVLTTLDMAAEGCRAALLDRRHHLELAKAQVPGIGLRQAAAW